MRPMHVLWRKGMELNRYLPGVPAPNPGAGNAVEQHEGGDGTETTGWRSDRSEGEIPARLGPPQV